MKQVIRIGWPILSQHQGSDPRFLMRPIIGVLEFGVRVKTPKCRFTLATIFLSGFDFRFSNSFYFDPELHNYMTPNYNPSFIFSFTTAIMSFLYVI
jgi:hypothetical protein